MALDPNDPRYIDDSLNPYASTSQMPHASKPRHAELGIASFVLAVLAIVVILSLFVAIAVMMSRIAGGANGPPPFLILIGLGILGAGAGSLLGIGLGIGGLVQPNRSRVLAVLGLLLNTLVVLGIAGLMLIGMRAQV